MTRPHFLRIPVKDADAAGGLGTDTGEDAADQDVDSGADLNQGMGLELRADQKKRRRNQMNQTNPNQQTPQSPENAELLKKSELAAGSTAQRVLAVMSGKGGVGKSSVAGLLAVALRRAGRRVGLLDADITGPSVPRLFGLRERPRPAPDQGIMPVETSTGIKIMSINLLLPVEHDPVIWRGPILSSAVKQFFTEVHWGELDDLIVDLPPGTGDVPLTVLQSLPLDGIVLVSSPQELSQMIVRKAVNMARALQVPIIGLIENMSLLHCPHCGHEVQVFGRATAQDAASAAGVRFLGRLPLDPALAAAGDAGALEAYDAPWVANLAQWVESASGEQPGVQ
jgi:Mrp family chromosome partitioning ATPase